MCWFSSIVLDDFACFSVDILSRCLDKCEAVCLKGGGYFDRLPQPRYGGFRLPAEENDWRKSSK